MDVQNFSPFYRTSSHLGAAAQKERERETERKREMTIDARDNITLTLPRGIKNVRTVTSDTIKSVRTVTSDTVKSVRSVKSVRMDTYY